MQLLLPSARLQESVLAVSAGPGHQIADAIDDHELELVDGRRVPVVPVPWSLCPTLDQPQAAWPSRRAWV